MTPTKTLILMFTEPSKSFSGIQVKSMILLPLLLVMLGTTLLYFWYYQFVDYPWLLDSMVANIADAAQREATKKVMTHGLILGSGMIGILVGTPAVYCLFALYFFLIAKLKNIPIGFEKWFAYIAWSSVPALLLLPLGAMQILLTRNGQLGVEQLNPTSLNQLFFHFAYGTPWQSFLDSISVPNIWGVVLMVLGYKTWTKQSPGSSIAVVMAPYLLIYSSWLAYILLSKSA